MSRRQRPPLLDRVRIERRASIVEADVPLNWDSGEQIEFDDGDGIAWEEAELGAGDGAGNALDEFRRVGPGYIHAQVNEIGGDESVTAEKLTGQATCIVIVRSTLFTRTITTDDRIVQILPGGGERVLNVRRAPPPGSDLYRFLLCEDGVAT